MSLIPKGSFDWARNSSVLKHLSIAGTLLNEVFMMHKCQGNVLYGKQLFFI